jgi:hypothetical protein
VIATFQFHNLQAVNAKLKIVVTTIKLEIHAAERLHLSLYKVRVYALTHFDAWVQNQFARMRTHTQTWLLEWIHHLDLAADGNAQIMALIPQLLTVTNGLAINQVGFYPVLP